MPKLPKPTNKLLLTIGVVLIIAIFLFTTFGCTCKRTLFTEGFEDAEKADAKKAETDAVPVKKAEEPVKKADADLSSKEKELFEDLKENKLSDTEITKLVKAGVLTDKLVEKFLEKLQNDGGDVMEGFTSVGSPYGCKNF